MVLKINPIKNKFFPHSKGRQEGLEKPKEEEAYFVDDKSVPIGTILPWLKSFASTPQILEESWVECNGQVLDDPDSPFDGETIPDLNGNNQFLRGNATSGGTGGSETMAHTHTGTASGTTGSHTLTENEIPSHNHTVTARTSDTGSGSYYVGQFQGPDGSNISVHNTGGGAGHTHSFSDGFTTSAASETENRPPFYNVVWIMKIRGIVGGPGPTPPSP